MVLFHRFFNIFFSKYLAIELTQISRASRRRSFPNRDSAAVKLNSPVLICILHLCVCRPVNVFVCVFLRNKWCWLSDLHCCLIYSGSVALVRIQPLCQNAPMRFQWVLIASVGIHRNPWVLMGSLGSKEINRNRWGTGSQSDRWLLQGSHENLDRNPTSSWGHSCSIPIGPFWQG